MKHKILTVILRIFIVLLVTGAVAVYFAYKTLDLIYHGPYESVKNLFVSSVTETKKGYFLASWFVGPQEISDIRNGIGRIDNDIDEVESIEESEEEVSFSTPELIMENTDAQQEELELVKISGTTFNGYMLIVKDPSRVSVATSYPFSEEGGKGKKLTEMAKENHAVAAINGGAFLYLGGDMPKGITISKGKTLSGEYGQKYSVIGFNNDNKLIVGKMKLEDAESLGLRDALSFSPILIKDGIPTNVSAYSLGLNPRSAIGQREDGSVLLLVIEGRMANSLGANYQDLVNVMVEYGAVNAATLDGGSSSVMYYEGSLISKCCSLYGPGRIPTCFIVSEKSPESAQTDISVMPDDQEPEIGGDPDE